MPFKPICHYDDPTYHYDKYWQSRQYEDQSERFALRRLLKLVKKKQSVLDLGGGYGRLADEYAPFFKKCLIIDQSQKHLSQAQDFCQKFTNLKLKKGLAESLPLEKESYQVIILVRTLHHLEQPGKAFQEISRILQPRGFLILEFANKFRFKNHLRALISGNLGFFTNHLPEDIKTKRGSPPFFNFHPNQIISLLRSNHFKIIKTYSISNFRQPWIKKIIPLQLLLLAEAFFSWLSGFIGVIRFFGPSIFILAQKQK